MLATSACAVPAKNNSTAAAARPKRISLFMRLPPCSYRVDSNLDIWINKSCGINWMNKGRKLDKLMKCLINDAGS
jgi:hypothetical protein